MEGALKAPLAGVTVVELSRGAAAAYAGRLLTTLGAETILVEPPAGHALRAEPPFLPPANEASALFAFLSCGKRSVVCDLSTASGRADLAALLTRADILVHDLDDGQRAALDLGPAAIRRDYFGLIDVSVRPFGAHGP